MRDCMELAASCIDKDELGIFVAVIWECWNNQNRFIFQKPDHNLAVLGQRAASFVKQYHKLKEKEAVSRLPHEAHWKPPVTGMLNLNYDGGQVGEAG